MEAGFAKEDITPPLGAFLLGTGLATLRPCDRVNDPICVRALAVRDAGEEALIFGIDSCFLGRAEADRFKGALGRELGLLPRQILLNASHTHSAPAACAYVDMRDVPPLHDYLTQLETALIRAGRRAIEGRQRVRIRAGVGRSRVPVNRRQLRDGRIVNAPNPGGPVLDSLPVAFFESEAGEPVALLFEANTHPVCMRDRSVSADYPGVAMDRLDAHLGRPCSLLLQGAGCGNSRPAQLMNGREWNWTSGWAEATAVGEALAAEAIDTLQAGLRPVEPRVRAALFEAEFSFDPLPRTHYEAVLAERVEDGDRVEGPTLNTRKVLESYRHGWAKRYLDQFDRGAVPRTLPLQVQGIQLGRGLRLIALECEPMAELGRAIEVAYAAPGRDADGSSVTFALGYSNGDGIYLVTTPMLAEGGYEAESYWEYGHPAPLAPGIEGVLDGALAELRRRGIG